MEKKIKVTYFQSGIPIQANIFVIYGWSNFANDLAAHGIMEDSVLKIEVVLEASDVNTIDIN